MAYHFYNDNVGVDDNHIILENTATPNQTLTISFWFRTSDPPSGFPVKSHIFSITNDAGQTHVHARLGYTVAFGAPFVYFEWKNPAGGLNFNYVDNSYLPYNITWVNQWYHLAFTIAAAPTMDMHVFINGVKFNQTSTVWTSAGIESDPNGYQLGGTGIISPGTSLTGFDGEISQFTVWNTILSDGEILNMYQARGLKQVMLQTKPKLLKSAYLDNEQQKTGVTNRTWINMIKNPNNLGQTTAGSIIHIPDPFSNQ